MMEHVEQQTHLAKVYVSGGICALTFKICLSHSFYIDAYIKNNVFVIYKNVHSWSLETVWKPDRSHIELE